MSQQYTKGLPTDSDVGLSTNSDLLIPTQKAVKTYVDQRVLESGGGTVGSVAVLTANGFSGTVASASTTPQITLATTVTGLLKGNGTAISAASAGTDYLAPSLDATVANLALSGTGRRITGDFSNATFSSRVSFQTTTTNAGTRPQLLPNGTSNNSSLNAFNNQDPTNAAYGLFGITATEMVVSAAVTGTGTYLPMTFLTGGSERVRIGTTGIVTIGSAVSLDPTTANALVVDSSGNVLSKGGGGLGYGIGSGGAVTQATSKSTGVTLNKITGRITMNNEALDGGASIAFYLTNSKIADGDIVIANVFGNGNYTASVATSYSSTALIEVKNRTAGSLSDAVGINFVVIKGAAS